MIFPDVVLKIVEEAVHKSPDNVDKSVEEAEKKIRKLATFNSIANTLITEAIQDLVYAQRSKDNRAIRKSTGYSGGKAKVIVGQSPSVQKVYSTVYEYRIAGQTLGHLMGEQLLPLSKAQKNVSESHAAMSKLLELLHPLVPTGKSVMEKVSQVKLRGLFKTVGLSIDENLESVE